MTQVPTGTHLERPGASLAPGLSAVLLGDPRRRRREKLIAAAFRAAAAFSILVGVLIVVSLLGEAVSFLRSIPLRSLWTDGWFPRRGMFDVKTILFGTLIVSVIAMVIAAPLGIGAAVFLSEYASSRFRRTVKPILETLAAIPSVVMGFFALTWISPSIVEKLMGGNSIFSMMAAGIGVGILVTPLVASIAEDAMHAVPQSLREASYGLAARRRTTSVRIVMPAAVSGIVASLIVGLSRAVGETMVVAIAAGASGGSLFTVDPFGPGQTMTGAMAALATGSDQVTGNSAAFQSLFFVGLLLFGMTLVLNLISERFVRRMRAKY